MRIILFVFLYVGILNLIFVLTFLPVCLGILSTRFLSLSLSLSACLFGNMHIIIILANRHVEEKKR